MTWAVGYFIGPRQLWSMLAEGVELDVEHLKLLALGVVTTRREGITMWSTIMSVHDRGIAAVTVDSARKIAENTINTIRILAEVSQVHPECEVDCVNSLALHLAVVAMYALGRIHGLRPVVREGQHRGHLYVITSLSEEGVARAEEEVIRDIDVLCEEHGVEGCT